MALSSDLTPFYYKPLNGMNNKTNPLDLDDKFVINAQNARFDPLPGSVTKRGPLYYFNSVTMSNVAVTGLYRYYKSDGTSKFIGTCGTSVYVGNDTSGTFTPIRSSMTLGKRMSFLTYKDLLIGSNGYDNPFVYDGNTQYVTWELGSCMAWTGSSQANLTVGSVTYQVTIDTDAYVCGAVSNTVTVTGCAIALSNIPLGPAGTANRKIYRKDSTTGTDYKLVYTMLDNTTTTYTDSSTTTSSTVLPAVTDDMPKGAELQIIKERLFIARDPVNPNRIYYSNTYLPHYIQQTTNLDYMDISPNDNDEIVGIPTFLGTMLCIKKNTIRKVYVSGPQQQWYAEDPFTFSGSPAPWSVCPTPYGIAYLGWDHWYMFDGANANPIIDEFDTTAVLSSDYNDTVCYFLDNELLAAYTLTSRAQAYHDRVMIYNFKRKAMSIDIINANCFTAKIGDNESGELYYGDSTTGYVYQGVKEDTLFKISSKNDCNSGSLSNVFIGGTDSSPFIEIGNSVTASSIPVNTCVFWNSETPPDSGWTELTTYDDMYVRSGLTNVTGNFGVTVSEAAQSTTSGIAINYVNWKVYYKNGSTTVNEFPNGSIILYDQAAVPMGYIPMDPNYYVKINSTSVNTIGQETIWSKTSSGLVSTLDNYISGNFIQRVGEPDSWDGLSRYCYCPTYSATISSNGWMDASATYNSYFFQTQQVMLTPNAGGDTEYGINAIRYPTTTQLFNYRAPDGSNTTSSTIGLAAVDGNFDSYANNVLGGNAYIYSVSTFESPIDITTIIYRLGAGSGVGEDSFRTEEYYIAYSTDGTNFTIIDSTHWNYYTGAAGSGFTDSGQVTVSVNLTGVKAIKAYAYGSSGQGQSCEGRLYEVQTYGKVFKYAQFPIAKKIFGKLNSYNGSWEVNSVTAGTWTSSVVEIDAQAMVRLWWNESLQGTDTVKVYFRTGATIGSTTSSSWGTAFTNPNGTSIASISANAFAQFKIDFMATDTTVSNPRTYSADGYVIQYSYSKGLVAVESSVEFIYEIGFRHFNQPMMDKIFRKIMTYHTGDLADQGVYTVSWETENSSGSFNVSLTTFPDYWDSFFPSDAMGKKINLKIYKNDLYSFKLHEIQGIYSGQPVIV